MATVDEVLLVIYEAKLHTRARAKHLLLEYSVSVPLDDAVR